ncbi:hypothetical protein O181_087393 [Austropuccinia psidii MF-1]|uniref:HORMA domain-containing protein n=1 Tax=Austropuccinia psidii MF-1 TaxID=1389203 RepID=A0A9Q3IPK1_9BASI|nr:hypothetical protein [Austropuccinia psidii MF-1]
MSSRRIAAGSLATRTRRTATANANTKQRINLAGSTAVVSDYFHYAINCILYQRAIYDQADFKMVKKFGLQMMIVEDEAIAEYLRKIVDQVRDTHLLPMCEAGGGLVLVNVAVLRLMCLSAGEAIADTRETIERWEFDVTLEDDPAQQPSLESANPSRHESKANPKSLSEIQSEIQVIIRQIIATVSFLPIPDSTRTFKVLAYTQRVNKDESSEWDDSEAFDITDGAERVKLKSFSTSVHRVETAVDYKLGESVV